MKFQPHLPLWKHYLPVHCGNWLSVLSILGACLLFSSCSPVLPAATNTPAPPVAGTSTPKAAPTASPSAASSSIAVPTSPGEAKHFQSPQGFFKIDYPAEWTVEPGDGSVTFTAPDRTMFLRISMVNSLYRLDDASFARLVSGRETNVFQAYPQFIEIDKRINTNSATVNKRFVDGGAKKIVFSYYLQSGEIVYVLDLWSALADLERAQGVYASTYPTLETDPAAVLRQDYGPLDNAYLYSTDYFSFEVPVEWQFTRTSSASSVVDTFRSPDEKAVFQTLVYSDGKPISKSTAGAFVLALLNDFYAQDIKITGDQAAEQAEVLVWNSPQSGLQGKTTFKVRHNTLIAVTTLYQTDAATTYQTLLDQIAGTYVEPPAGDAR